MCTKTNPHAIEEKLDVEPQEISSSAPKMIEPITTVPSTKPKKKTSTKSTTKKKKPSKSKKGESKAPLTMADLYEKENAFVSTVVEPNVGTSVKDPKNVDVEAAPKIAPDVTTSDIEKGNPDETLTSDVSESGKKLGLEDLNAASECTENMDVDDPETGVKNMVDDCVQLSSEKTDDRKDVGPDVGTSLDQQDKQDNDSGTLVRDESGFMIASENEVLSGDTVVNSPSDEDKQTEAESDPEEDPSVEKDEKDVVNVNDINSDDVPLGKRYGESVAMRLRSNKGIVVLSTSKKVVPDISETPSVMECPKTGVK